MLAGAEQIQDEAEIGDRHGCLTLVARAAPTRSCETRLRVQCLCGRKLFVSQNRFLRTEELMCECNRPGPQLYRATLPETVHDTAKERRKAQELAKRPSKRARGLARLRAKRKAANVQA